MAGLGMDRAVDHQQVAIEHAMAAQAWAADAHVKGRQRVGHQKGVEIEQLPPSWITEGEGLIQGQAVEHREPGA
ncbi:MAG: hypothetical protein ACKO8I_04980 [Cyanobacteriota bacterium]